MSGTESPEREIQRKVFIRNEKKAKKILRIDNDEDSKDQNGFIPINKAFSKVQPVSYAQYRARVMENKNIPAVD